MRAHKLCGGMQRRAWRAASPAPSSGGGRQQVSSADVVLRSAVQVWWPSVNALLVIYLLYRRYASELSYAPGGGLVWGSVAGDAAAIGAGGRGAPCDKELEAFACVGGDCGEHGACMRGRCQCNDGWGGANCTQRACLRGCSGHGTCFEGVCLCDLRWAGDDCSADVRKLRNAKLFDAVTDEQIGRNGRFEKSLEHVMNLKSIRKYPNTLCQTKACQNSWSSQFEALKSHLPRVDFRDRFTSCAVVSSSKSIVYNATSGYRERRQYGRGAEIDKHRAIFRLDNAPTDSFEKWVGKRTTHRLVHGDYAQFVHNMMGTEVVVNQTNSIVTPTTWWAGTYPAIERVIYIMAVEPILSKSQIRARNNAYVPFGEIFPGNNHYLLSPLFMKQAVDLYTKYKESIMNLNLGCFKSKEIRVPQIYVALIYALQVCNKVHVYGMNFSAYEDGQSKKDSLETCCYYDKEEGYASRSPLCDRLTRDHVIHNLMTTGKIKIHQ